MLVKIIIILFILGVLLKCLFFKTWGMYCGLWFGGKWIDRRQKFRKSDIDKKDESLEDYYREPESQ